MFAIVGAYLYIFTAPLCVSHPKQVPDPPRPCYRSDLSVRGISFVLLIVYSDISVNKLLWGNKNSLHLHINKIDFETSKTFTSLT
jgi:hypothetical protein